LVWNFVESCARGQLPVAECGPVFQIAAIVILVVMAVVLLVWLIFQAEPLEFFGSPTDRPATGSSRAGARNRPQPRVAAHHRPGERTQAGVKDVRDRSK